MERVGWGWYVACDASNPCVMKSAHVPTNILVSELHCYDSLLLSRHHCVHVCLDDIHTHVRCCVAIAALLNTILTASDIECCRPQADACTNTTQLRRSAQLRYCVVMMAGECAEVCTCAEVEQVDVVKMLSICASVRVRVSIVIASECVNSCNSAL